MRFNNSTQVSPVYCDSLVIIQVSDSSKFMRGAVEGVSGAQATIPQLSATAYLNGVALSPQPNFKWTADSTVSHVDQSGNVTRSAVNPNAFSFDSNGAPSTGQLGSIVTVRATYLRQDGSESGVYGEIKIAIQAQGDSAQQRASNSHSGVAADGINNTVRNIVVLDGVTNQGGTVNYNNDGAAGVGRPSPFPATHPNSSNK